jgi:hypothetical protein
VALFLAHPVRKASAVANIAAKQVGPELRHCCECLGNSAHGNSPEKSEVYGPLDISSIARD